MLLICLLYNYYYCKCVCTYVVIRDLTAKHLFHVCYNICLELGLQKLNNEHFQIRTANIDDNTRLDICTNAFWESSERAFFNVWVLNPFAPTNLKHLVVSCYCLHEMENRRQHDECVREVERRSFTPLVLSTSGGMRRQGTVFFKRLASLLARKRDQPYSHVIGWIRCHLRFSLFRSSITCLRGTRSIAGFVPSPTYPETLDLTISEGQVPLS